VPTAHSDRRHRRFRIVRWSLIATVLASIVASAWASGHDAGAWTPQPGTLLTRWAADVDPALPLPEYPRPQLVRDHWLNLNGLWSYAITRGLTPPEVYDGSLLVPFPVESSLSGVMRRVGPDQRLWYQRTFEIPDAWRGQRVVLHFGAVDWEATVWVNGALVGSHRGGYDPFSFDVTDALEGHDAHEVVVRVFDPTDAGDQPRGKQVLAPNGIWYTPVTGIWQTVWLEPVAEAHIAGLRLDPSFEHAHVRITLDGGAASDRLTLSATATVDGIEVASASGPSDRPLQLDIPDPRGWSPDDPFLYDLELELRRGEEIVDRVSSYFGLRDVTIADMGGVTRILLNGEALFQFGTLDQGFWPDGRYTAPTDEALRFDLEITKQLGFNMVRKHVKVEPARWYAWADRIGLLVWQDMPNGGPHFDYGAGEASDDAPWAAQFERELFAVVDALQPHPSIVTWVIFNEGWGQHDTARLGEALAPHDPSRLINSASGWNDVGTGDMLDVHWYTGPGAPGPSPGRAPVLGEFGGFGLPVLGHTLQDADNWGYQSLADPDALTEAYLGAIERLWPLIADPGLAAAVYTQITDVETEVNGLLTYDRAVVKMDVALLQAAHARLYRTPPVRLTLVPTSERDAHDWRWTIEPPAGAWTGLDFDDGSWDLAPAGFGDGYVPQAVTRTTWASDAIWMRTAFELDADPSDLTNLTLRVHHDAEVDIYLNGQPIVTLPFYTQRYVDVVRDDALRAALRPGRNVLAARTLRAWGGQYIDIGLSALDASPPR
jgi:hypothetical protein